MMNDFVLISIIALIIGQRMAKENGTIMNYFRLSSMHMRPVADPWGKRGKFPPIPKKNPQILAFTTL